MKIKFGLIFLTIIFALTACNVNFNSPRANQNVPMRWSATVCSSKAKKVILYSGRDGGDARSFAEWQENAPQKKFDLPADAQTLSKIYFKAVAPERGQTEMCVLYDGKAKKRVEFDDEEDVHVNATDSDSADRCRCTE